MRSLVRNRISGKVAIIEPVVGIQRRVAVIPISAAMIFVATGLGDELDLHRALG